MKRIVLIGLLAAVGCTRLADEVVLYEIGCPEPEVRVGSAAGTCSAEILSDGAFTATLPPEASWLHFTADPSASTLQGSGDCSLSFTFDINRSIPRKAVVTLVRGTAAAALTIVQEGLLDGGLDVVQKGITVAAEGGAVSVRVNTLLKPSDITVTVTYGEQADWMTRPVLEGGFLHFSAAPNQSASVRHARIGLAFDGGDAVVLVTQYSVGSGFSPVDIPALKAMLPAAGSLTLDAHYVVEGVVLNDYEGNNGAENRLVSADSPDLGQKDRVMYLQDAAGTDGLRLVFTGRCDQAVQRWARVGVDLAGAVLTRFDDPVRYAVSGLPVSAIVSSVDGGAVAPRTKAVGDLEAADLYTLVTLPDVEIPVRKGPFVPVDIRQIGVMTAYPMVLRDIRGDRIPLMVNVDCPWSRDGRPMPQGSGSVTGVLVHETCDNFEWDTAEEALLKGQGVFADYITGLGDIGPWQIRPMERDDIALAEDLQDGFSALLCEWRYCDSLGVNLVPNYVDATLFPTWPEVEDPRTLDAAFYCVGASGERLPLGLCNDFTHLGPYTFGSSITQPSGGNGVVDAQGRSAHWYVYGAGNGVIYSYYPTSGSMANDWTASNGSAWQVKGWSRRQWWCAEFSTAELSGASAPLSVQFGTMGCISGSGAPRRWAVECSTDGTAWQRVEEYTVPDFVTSTGKKVWQLPGTKYVSVNLPDTLLGREKVYVRLVPASDKVGTSVSYEGGTSVNALRYNAINYFSIRYNK